MQTENPVVEEPVETEIPDEEIIGAIDEELEAVAGEPEPEPEPTPDPEPEPAADPEPTGDPEPEPTPDPSGEPEPAADPEPEKPAEPEPESEPAKPAEEGKPSDEFGTLEEGTPERTRERFETMKGRFDEVSAELQAIKEDADEWKGAILGTGTNPEQFGMTLNYLSKVNSGKPEDLQEAYDIMSGELEALGKMLGKPAPGVYNPLDEHPDLKQKVDDGMMDESAAMEVVEARATKKLHETSTSAHSAEQQRESAVHNALEEVKQLGVHLKATDPNFEAKVDILKPIIEAVVTSGAEPAKWKGMIEQTYQKVQLPAAPAPTPVQRETMTAPNPLRPTGTSPAANPMEKEPGSELEAINQALERGY